QVADAPPGAHQPDAAALDGAPQEPAQEALARVAHELPLAVRVGEAQDRASHAVGALVEPVVMLRRELVHAVHVGGLAGVVLVYGHGARPPVDLARARPPPHPPRAALWGGAARGER